MPKVGEMVMYRHGDVMRKASVSKVISDTVVDVNVLDSGMIMFGKESCQMATTAQEQAQDGCWWPMPT
jgi:hypothetical protein